LPNAIDCPCRAGGSDGAAIAEPNQLAPHFELGRLGATSEEIIAFCREGLTEYKVPRLVEVRETLPMSAVGKILYRVLRDEHATAASARS